MICSGKRRANLIPHIFPVDHPFGEHMDTPAIASGFPKLADTAFLHGVRNAVTALVFGDEQSAIFQLCDLIRIGPTP